jgi:hypothetical protein
VGASHVATLPSAVSACGRSPDPQPEDVVRLTLAAKDAFPVARLVLGAAAARCGFDVRQIDHIAAALDLALRSHVMDGSVEIVVRCDPMLEAWVGPFPSGSALGGDCAPVMSSLVDDLVVCRAPVGDWIVLRTASSTMADRG